MEMIFETMVARGVSGNVVVNNMGEMLRLQRAYSDAGILALAVGDSDNCNLWDHGNKGDGVVVIWTAATPILSDYAFLCRTFDFRPYLRSSLTS